MKTNMKIKDESVNIQGRSTNRLFGFRDYHQVKKLKTDRLNNSLPNKVQELSICAWCEKFGNKSFTIQDHDGDLKVLCSEVCFNQYRRDSFKKNKNTNSCECTQTMKIQSFSPSKFLRKHEQTNEFSRRLFPETCLPLPKRHRSSSFSSDSTAAFPINSTPSPFIYFPTPPTNPNYSPYPTTNITPNLPLLSSRSSLVTKESLSDYTWIYSSIIPLSIPVPLCIPIQLSYLKNSTNLINQPSQNEMQNTG